GLSFVWEPATARAQRPAMPVIGFLSLSPVSAFREPIAALHDGLKETGYVEGQNVTGSSTRWCRRPA
ncbi:MAG: hypothetical protein ACREKH_08920, partial [Candidatus Rokuibacteriota bacterium]